MSVNKRLQFQDLFDEAPLDVNEYLKGISKDVLWKTIALLINISNPESSIKTAKDLINQWFSLKNRKIRDRLLRQVSPTDGIINIVSSLNLVEHILNYQISNEDEKDELQIEVNLFKAYLVFNSNQNHLEDFHLKSLEPLDDIEQEIGWSLIMRYHDYDLENYIYRDVFTCQLIKSIEFFKYLESRDELEPHLTLFLSKYNCTSWSDWIIKIVSLIFPIISITDKSYHEFTVTNDEKYIANCKFLDSFSTTETDDHHLSDFIILRSKPLLKIADGQYRIISKLFLIEKLFKSIQFQFSLEINVEVNQANRISDFRSYHCDNFSEKTLLYKIMKNCFPKKWIHLSGKDFKNHGYDKEPDYYIRFKNKIFLFESKDVVLKGEEKQSRNYLLLKKAISDKFYKTETNGTVISRAIVQIIENIKRIYRKFYSECDQEYNIKTIKIFPIIVTHDRQFDCIGLNNLIKLWFKNELLSIDSEIILSNIRDPIILNIDTLLFHQESIKNRGQFRLDKLICDYHFFTDFQPKQYSTRKALEDGKLESFCSFSYFADKYFDKKSKNKIPTYVMQYVQQLFNDP